MWGWRRLGSAVLGLLLPLRCRACGQSVHPLPENPTILKIDDAAPADNGCGLIMKDLWCPVCVSKFRPIDSPLCNRCGILFSSREGMDHLCGSCISAPGHFTRARAVGIYDGPLMAMIHGLKYRENTALARPLSTLLYSGFQRFWDAERIDLVLPVPLHPKRMRRRGFNQAWLLIRDWPDRFKRTDGIACGIEVHKKYLLRHRSTAPQTGLGKLPRRHNIKNAFSVAPTARITEKRILLVDDVMTTGATVNECARVLLAAGARQVDVLTLARTM